MKKPNLKPSIKTFVWCKAIFKYCFMMLLLTLFVGASASSFYKTHSNEALVLPTVHLAISNSNLLHLGVPNHQLLADYPIMKDLFSLDEDLIDEDLDEHCPNDILGDLHEQLFQSVAEKLFSAISNTTKNRASIPFFILYHSWKSYLS